MKEKKQRPRTENKARFAEEYTEEDFLRAIDKCLENATCTAAEVAEVVGCSPRYAKDRLIELAEEKKIQKKLKGVTWGFRP
jgi:hypothetical protein